MSRVSLQVLLLVGLLIGRNAPGCIWDSDTLADEKSKSPTLAKAILEESSALTNDEALRTRIVALQSKRQENDPAWWNELAGAHIRLGNPKAAAELLETVVARFPDDYGIHANLGTAYHLLGRYAEAEREIACDLEINPDAHFGLERYHLALLQYLTRDDNYQRRHVYVDEFSSAFIYYQAPFFVRGPDLDPPHGKDTNELATLKVDLERQYAELVGAKPLDHRAATGVLAELIAMDLQPSYRKKWDLADDPNLEKGVIYMAGLNQQQPACFVMLGILAAKGRDLNLAIAAFERAVKLGSPQADILDEKIASLRKHVSEARGHARGITVSLWLGVLVVSVVLVSLVSLVFWVIRKMRRAAGN